MKLLLDTHVIIWVLTDDPRLTKSIRKMINDKDNIIFYSTASLWEIAVKNYKYPAKCPYNESTIEELCDRSGFHCLNISTEHIKALRDLKIKADRTLSNYDPFDRMLISQARNEGAYLLSHDRNFDNYDETCITMI